MDHHYLRKVKRGKGDGLWGSYLVDEDEHGRWFFTPERSRYRGTNGDRVGYCYVGQPDEPGLPVIHLVPPPTEWWFARWQGDHVAIDICTPSVLVEGGGTPGGHANVWSYDDLELDLFKRRDGEWGVTDEDEFLEAHFDGFIDHDEVRTSLETAGRLRARLAAGDDLFDDLAWRRLAECIERPLAPLTELP
jgi:hypothetical protein